MPSTRGTTATDDRGERFAPVPLFELARHAEDQESRAAARTLQRSLRRVIKEEARRWSFSGFGISVALGIGLVVLLIIASLALNRVMGGTPFLLVLIAIVVGVVSIDRHLAKGRIRRSLASTIVAHGFCARCGYSLQGLQPDDNNHLPCPECGCAWNPRRITRPHWEPPRPPLDRRPNWRAKLRMLRPPMIADHHGMLCRRLDSYLLGLNERARDEIGPKRQARIRRAIRRPSLWLRLSVSALVSTGLVWLALHWPDDPRRDHDELLTLRVLWGFGVGTLVLIIAGILNSELGITANRAVRALTDEDLCPSCATDLPQPDPEGCRVCPTCGATWRKEHAPQYNQTATPARPGPAP